MKINKDQYYIVRANRAGVFFGKIAEKKDTSVTMRDVRKIHSWHGACAVEQISIDGIGNGNVTVIVPEMEISEPIQIIPCTDKSTENLKRQPVWKK